MPASYSPKLTCEKPLAQKFSLPDACLLTVYVKQLQVRYPSPF